MEETDMSGFRQIVSELESQAETMSGPVEQGMIEGGEIWLAYLRSRFDSEGDGDWKQLADSTVEQRKRKGIGGEHMILQESGDLLKSLTPGDPNNVLRATPDGVELGSAVPYAPFVNAARPFIVPPDAVTKEQMEAALQRRIDEMTRDL
nr:hypothetical protein [uncultured Rhodopila sp.]